MSKEYGQAIPKRIVKGKQVDENMFGLISNWGNSNRKQKGNFAHCSESIKHISSVGEDVEKLQNVL